MDFVGQRVEYIERYEAPAPDMTSWSPVRATGTIQSIASPHIEDPRKMVFIRGDNGETVLQSVYSLLKV